MVSANEKIADYGSILPGNALGTTWLPDWLDPTQYSKVGEGAKQANWTDWLSDVGNVATRVLNPVGAFMPTAAEIAKDTASQTSGFVRRTVDKAVGAVTGVGETTAGFFSGFRDSLKYLAWALIALAVIYVLATVMPAVTRGK